MIEPPQRRFTPTQRTRLSRGFFTFVLLASAAAVVLGPDWSQIRRFFFDWDIIISMFPNVITTAAKNTLLYTAGSFLFGLVLGVMFALMRLSTIRAYRWIATVYIEVFRGIPALITIFMVGFGLPLAFNGFQIPGGLLGQASFALGVVAAAYMAETIRAGIQAVDKGQMEAARSLGMTYPRALFSIILPQAFRIIIPPLTNEFVLLLKDTSLIFVLGATVLDKELTKFGRDLVQPNASPTPLIVVAFMYLLVTVPMTQAVAALERRQQATR